MLLLSKLCSPGCCVNIPGCNSNAENDKWQKYAQYAYYCNWILKPTQWTLICSPRFCHHYHTAAGMLGWSKLSLDLMIQRKTGTLRGAKPPADSAFVMKNLQAKSLCSSLFRCDAQVQQ